MAEPDPTIEHSGGSAEGAIFPSLGQSVFFIEGWIKLHRKTLESPVFQNEKYLKVWLWCLMRANHQATRVAFNGEDIPLRPGQFITGRDKACEQLCISPRTYRTAIDYLKSTNRIVVKTTNRFSVISVVKWAHFQDGKPLTTNTKYLVATSHRPTNDQPPTTDKNEKNIIPLKIERPNILKRMS